MWHDYLNQQIAIKQEQHNQRFLIASDNDGCMVSRAGQRLINLSGNDYLGLGCEPWRSQLRASFRRRQPECQDGYEHASGASQLLTGYSSWHARVEAFLAQHWQRQAALTFTSGYQMNMGLISALCSGADTLILADKQIHASMIDGILLSKAKFYRFHHNDMAHLEQLLHQHSQHYERILVVTESVFSMDGDKAPLAALVQLKKQYSNVALYVDEAHAIGVYGDHGLGCAQEQNCLQEIDFLVGTFGKAVHSVGGYLVCDGVVREYLINYARPLIFSTALPPVNMAWTLLVLEQMLSMQTQRQYLHKISQQIIDLVRQNYGSCLSSSHIIPVITHCSAKAIDFARQLEQQGILVMPIRPPTVAPNQSRVRISLHAGLDSLAVEQLVYGLSCSK